MKNTHLRFISWTAVSSKPQSEKESLEIQRRLNHEFVAELSRYYPGYSGTIVKELEVVGSRMIVELSEARERWPAYAQLINLIKLRAFDVLIVSSRDRLGREGSLILTIERMCWQYDIVVLPRQSLPPTLDIQALRLSEYYGLIGAIESHFARAAVRRLINESVMGRRARVEKRRLFAGRTPWGYFYRYDEQGNQDIAIDHEIEKTIRWLLLDLFVGQRLSYMQIAEEMNAQGITPPRGDKWTRSGVNKFIRRSQTYAGYLTINRERQSSEDEEIILEGKHSAIITDEEWIKITEEIERRSIVIDPPVSAYANSVYCSVSGKRMWPTRRNNGRNIAFECKGCDTHHLIAESRVDDAARSWIALVQENATEFEQDQEAISYSIRALQKECDHAVAEKAKAEKAVGKILDRYIYGYISLEEFDHEVAAYEPHISSIENGIGEISRKIESLRADSQPHYRAVMIWAREMGLLSIINGDPQRANAILGKILRIFVESRREGEGKARVVRIEIL